MTPSDTPEFRATVAQLDPVLGDVDENLATVEATIAKAKAHNSDLVVFPELFLTGYHIDNDAESLTEEAAKAIADIRPLTEDLVVVLGSPTFDDSELYNSAVVLQDRVVEGEYRKTHLYGDEPGIFESGNTFPTFDTSVGTLGIEICYDVEFPEVARQLTLNGADVIITISANMRPCIRDQELYHGTRAIENGKPHILCNRVGAEREVDFFGNSGIVDSQGRRILSVGADLTETASASVPQRPNRGKTHDYIGDRRPDIYDL